MASDLNFVTKSITYSKFPNLIEKSKLVTDLDRKLDFNANYVT